MTKNRLLMPTAVGILATMASLSTVNGHGYMTGPRSRNYVAFQETVWWPQTEDDPNPETCPHCLNRGGSLAQCGISQQKRNYDVPLNALGGPMSTNQQATYLQGQDIVIDVTLTAHHKGHFEFAVCAIAEGEKPTTECFEQNKLTFVKDLFYGANYDPNYPHRAYVAPLKVVLGDEGSQNYSPDYGTTEGLMDFKFTMRLPEGVSGDLVLLQWYYLTANTCIHDGYSQYDWPAGWRDDAMSASPCGYVSPDGLGTPEQFWNCAETRILPSSYVSSTVVSTTTTSSSNPTAHPSTGNPITSNPTSHPSNYPVTDNPTSYPISNPPSDEVMVQMSNIAIPVSEGSASYLTSGPKLGLSSHGKTIIGYYASWQWYDRNKLASPENMDFTKVQRVNYAFFQTNTNGDLWGTDSWGDPNVLFGPYDWNPSESSKEFCSWDSPTDRPCNYHKYQQGLIHLVHAAGAELYPSIGGWTLSDAFPAMSANPTARANFAKNCIELIQAYDFDGIDIDWEYPGYEAHSGTPNDRENFRLLLDEVRSALDTFGGQTGRFYGLTAALPCGPSHIANLDIAHVARTLSELNLMTYDFNGAFSPVTGMNSPLYPQGWGEEGFSVHECVQNWLAGGGTKDKINVGLPFYGRSFAGATELNKPHDGADQAVWGIDDGTPQYYNIMAQLPNMNHIWDKRTWTDWAYFTSGGAVSYDSVNAICAKTQYAIENELNGFIIWELSGDVMADLSTPLLDVVNTKLLDPSFGCGETGLYPHEVEASAETDSSPSVITTTQITNDGSENGLPTFPIDTPASPISDQLPSTVNEEQPVFVPAPSPFTDNISTTTDSNPSTVDIVQPTSPTVNDLQPTPTSDFSMVADPTNPGQYQYFIQCQSSYSSTPTPNNSTPNNLSFRYEMHRHPLVSSTEAMKDAKTSMLNDLNKHLGCQNQSSGSIGRNLLNTRAQSVLDYIVGIMSSPMDSEYKEAPCSVPVNLDTASVCDSMVGQLTLFLDPNTPAVLAEEIWRETMFTLRTGMAAGRYETSKVLKTIFIEDTTANQLTESNTNTIPSMTVWNDESESQSKPNIAVTVVCILIVIAILVAQAIFFKKSKSNATKQAYNNEEISRLGSISRLESIGSGEADVESVWKAALHTYEEETNSKEGVDPEYGYVVTTGSDSSSSQESNTHVETSNEDSEAPNSQDPPADGEDDISAMSDSQDGAVSDLFDMELFELQTELEIHGVDSSNMEKEELVDAILTARRRKRQDVD